MDVITVFREQAMEMIQDNMSDCVLVRAPMKMTESVTLQFSNYEETPSDLSLPVLLYSRAECQRDAITTMSHFSDRCHAVELLVKTKPFPTVSKAV